MKTKKEIEPCICGSFDHKRHPTVTPDNQTHTEDCMDANDDTSVFKGRCICPKPTHTPTPWTQEKARYWKLLSEGKHFMSVSFPSGVSDELTNSANAAYIVRAVNSHEELLEALKQLANVTNQKGMNRVVVNSIVDRAWKAIAKAEGK